MKMKDIKQKQIDRIVEIAATDASYDAPDFAIKYAKNLFFSRAVAPKPTFLQRLTAVLTAEIAAGVPAFGERSASASSERQLFFQAGEIGIDLRIADRVSTRSVRGQILGSEAIAKDVRLNSGGREQTAEVADSNSFMFESVEKGSISMTIRFDKNEVVIDVPNDRTA